MGTYLYPHFDTYPYLQLYGPKGSGKTKTLTLLAATSFNAVLSSSIKPAGLFRIIERSGATLLLDEAERLNNRENPELAEVLRAGYKKPSAAIRVQEKNSHRENSICSRERTFQPSEPSQDNTKNLSQFTKRVKQPSTI